MKPVIIFRFAEVEGPGFLGDFLQINKIPFALLKVDAGETLPSSIQGYSGLVLMGGPMSVNDDLPWIAPLLNLIREAVALNIPLLGHCLGGQLISKALGASVKPNPMKEIGWGEVTVSQNETAKLWFGEMESFNGFHWHGETFSLPQGSVHLLASQYCKNQAYALDKHLVLQCHIEMTVAMVEEWCEIGADEMTQASTSPGVQPASQMIENLPIHCFFLNKVANRVYAQWIKGLIN
jgi:GMP synthase-like glutamine amidotransferase